MARGFGYGGGWRTSGGGGNVQFPRPMQTQTMPQGGFAFPGIPAPPPSPNFNINAQQSPELLALSGRFNKYLDDIEKGTGHAMDVAGQKFRDIREGGKATLRQGEAARGVNTSNRAGEYEAATSRGEQQAIGDMAAERERMRGGALAGALGAAKAPLEMALQEKNFGLGAWQANNAAQNSQFQNFLALLQAQRSSPIYTG